MLALRTRPGGAEIGVALGVAAVYLMVFLRMGIPEERTHLIEYRVVAVFICEALAERASQGRRVPYPRCSPSSRRRWSERSTRASRCCCPAACSTPSTSCSTSWRASWPSPRAWPWLGHGGGSSSRARRTVRAARVKTADGGEPRCCRSGSLRRVPGSASMLAAPRQTALRPSRTRPRPTRLGAGVRSRGRCARASEGFAVHAPRVVSSGSRRR